LELPTLGPLFHMRKFHNWNFQTWYVRLQVSRSITALTRTYRQSAQKPIRHDTRMVSRSPRKRDDPSDTVSSRTNPLPSALTSPRRRVERRHGGGVPPSHGSARRGTRASGMDTGGSRASRTSRVRHRSVLHRSRPRRTRAARIRRSGLLDARPQARRSHAAQASCAHGDRNDCRSIRDRRRHRRVRDRATGALADDSAAGRQRDRCIAELGCRRQ
jgi:hypothetical protein